MGTLKNPEFLTGPACKKYNRPRAEEMPAEARQAPDCIWLYREILAAQPDHSVKITGIGPLRNLADLRSSEADSVSPLSGCGLIAKKVARLTLMAGNFARTAPGRPEWNVEMGLTSARLIQETWPGEVNLLGWEAGADVIALRELHALSPKILRPGLSPVCRRYGPQQLGSVHGAMGHASQLSLLTPSTPGLVTLDAQGVSRWRPMPGGRHRFLSSGRRAGGNRRGYEKT